MTFFPDEPEEEFLPMKVNAGVSDSILSEATLDSSITSTITSATINRSFIFTVCVICA